jgi:hypothetical protein
MKTVLLSILIIIISTALEAQTENKLILQKKAKYYKNNQFREFELPHQMIVNWYDTSGVEHNDDKTLLYVLKDTLFFEVPKNDTLVEAIAYNQIESIKVFNVGKILLKPIALASTAIFSYGAIGSIALLGYGFTSYRSGESFYLFFAGLLVAGIDVPFFYISKALWEASNMTFKTQNWKQVKR